MVVVVSPSFSVLFVLEFVPLRFRREVDVGGDHQRVLAQSQLAVHQPHSLQYRTDMMLVWEEESFESPTD